MEFRECGVNYFEGELHKERKQHAEKQSAYPPNVS